jgi:hypothetical protein
MRIFDYTAIGILIVCMLGGTKALPAEMVLADMAQVVAPDATQSPPGEDEGDLLNLLD